MPLEFEAGDGFATTMLSYVLEPGRRYIGFVCSFDASIEYYWSHALVLGEA